MEETLPEKPGCTIASRPDKRKKGEHTRRKRRKNGVVFRLSEKQAVPLCDLTKEKKRSEWERGHVRELLEEMTTAMTPSKKKIQFRRER